MTRKRVSLGGSGGMISQMSESDMVSTLGLQEIAPATFGRLRRANLIAKSVSIAASALSIDLHGGIAMISGLQSLITKMEMA